MTVTPLRLVSLNILVLVLFSALRAFMPLSFEEEVARGLRGRRLDGDPGGEVGRAPASGRVVVRPVVLAASLAPLAAPRPEVAPEEVLVEVPVYSTELEDGEIPSAAAEESVEEGEEEPAGIEVAAVEPVAEPEPEPVSQVELAGEVPEPAGAAEARGLEPVAETLEVAEAPDLAETPSLDPAPETLEVAEAPVEAEEAVEIATAPEEESEATRASFEEEAPRPAPPGETPSPEETTRETTGPTTLERYSQAVQGARRAIRSRDWQGALEVLAEGLSLEDLVGEQRAWLLYLRAKAERRLGREELAMRLYSEAIDYDPPGAHYKNSLAWMLATSRKSQLRDVSRAVSLAEEAVEEGGRRAQYLDTLARAYFEAGRLGEAVQVQMQAVARDPAKRSYKNRLDWYREEAGGPALSRSELAAASGAE